MGTLPTKTQFPFHELVNCHKHICQYGHYRCRDYDYCVPLQYNCDDAAHCFKVTMNYFTANITSQCELQCVCSVQSGL